MKIGQRMMWMPSGETGTIVNIATRKGKHGQCYPICVLKLDRPRKIVIEDKPLRTQTMKVVTTNANRLISISEARERGFAWSE